MTAESPADILTFEGRPIKKEEKENYCQQYDVYSVKTFSIALKIDFWLFSTVLKILFNKGKQNKLIKIANITKHNRPTALDV